MSEIVFARTRWNYASYVDYWNLVKLSGFRTVWLDDMDLYDPNATYIISPMNGEFMPYVTQFSDRVSKIVLWNLERPSGSNGLQNYVSSNHQYINDGWLDVVIVSDRQLANDTGFRYVPLGSHEGLGTPGSLNAKLKGYDLIHLCCYSNHRSYLFETPEKNKEIISGLSVASNGWGHERHIRLMHSRFMLNIHQDEFPYMEPLRFSLAAAYGLPILSERCIDPHPYITGWITMEDDINKLLNSEWVRSIVEYASVIHPLGLTMRKHMTTRLSFRACLEEYLWT
jgi:hypothetical protein